MTITGRTLGQELSEFKPFPQQIVRALSEPLAPHSSLVVLQGNISPNGCVLKQSAMAPHLKKHVGKAVVFSGMDDMLSRIDSPDLEVDQASVYVQPITRLNLDIESKRRARRADDANADYTRLILQNIGPVGNPGMPEAGYIPIPRRLAQAGVKDMLRISDGRMSGTAAGAIVLHVSPEAAVGGPLAVLRSGDIIELDVEERRLVARVSEDEMAERLDAWRAAREERSQEGGGKRRERGYRGLYKRSVLQAEKGADFDFLTADYE
jgi:dihydroxy-acid dehydratase